MATTVITPRYCNHSRPNFKRYVYHPSYSWTSFVEANLADSLSAGSKTAIEGMLTFYHGDEKGGIPGIFNQDEGYFWWIAGAAWNVHRCHQPY